VSQTKATLKEQLKQLDIPGLSSFVPAISMLLLAVQWGGITYPWNSAIIIGLFCGSIGTFIVFFALEWRRGKTAMLPLSFLRMRVVLCAAVIAAFSGGSFMLISYYLPVWFQVVKGESPIVGGVHYLPSVGATVFASVASGTLGMFHPQLAFQCCTNTYKMNY
jgi:hypothetical protein